MLIESRGKSPGFLIRGLVFVPENRANEHSWSIDFKTSAEHQPVGSTTKMGDVPFHYNFHGKTWENSDESLDFGWFWGIRILQFSIQAQLECGRMTSRFHHMKHPAFWAAHRGQLQGALVSAIATKDKELLAIAPGHSPRGQCAVRHMCSWNSLEYILVGGFNPSEKYESQLGWLVPIYGKIKVMFQTTNQYSWHMLRWMSSPESPLGNVNVWNVFLSPELEEHLGHVCMRRLGHAQIFILQIHLQFC